MFVPTILLQGGVVGTRKRELKKDAVSVTPYFFISPKKTETHAFEDAAAHYANFLGKDLELS